MTNIQEKHPEALTCPMCSEGEMNYTTVGQSHIYVCDACPAILFEYYGDIDYDNLGIYLNGGVRACNAPDKVYHLTDIENLEAITTEGLLTWHPFKEEIGKIYLTSEWSQIIYNDYDFHGRELALLEVDIKGFKNSIFVDPEYDQYGDDEWAWFCTQDIPAKNIKFMGVVRVEGHYPKYKISFKSAEEA